MKSSLALLLIFFCIFRLSADEMDLEAKSSDFVLETKRIEILEYPDAFNPSIVPWRSYYLMSFRILPDLQAKFNSQLGVVLLDANFSPVSPPQLLNTREEEDAVPSRAEDARLLYVGDRLYVIYDDHEDLAITRGGFRMYVSELVFNGSYFVLKDKERLSFFEGENKEVREKNWVPFDFQGTLLLAYSLLPHKIFMPLLSSTGHCQTVATSSAGIYWDWGTLKGGTPGLQGLLPNGDYLAFFHTWKAMASAHSGGEKMPHYFFGAYTFSKAHPFEINRISPEPIIAKGFFSGAIYKPYWHPIRCVFPGGFVYDEQFIWVVYGRQDRELWVVKLDRHKLIGGLIPVESR